MGLSNHEAISKQENDEKITECMQEIKYVIIFDRNWALQYKRR